MDSEEIKKTEERSAGDSENGYYQDYTSDYNSSNYESIAEEPESKSNSTIALIMGILSLVFCCCSIVGIIPGIVGIIFANKAKKNGETSGMATAGMVCSIIGIIFGVLVTIFYAIYGIAVMSLWSEWNQNGVLDQIQGMDSSELQDWINQNYDKYGFTN